VSYSGDLLIEGRRRADVGVRELARRLRRPASTVARWESGTSEPSLLALREAFSVMGLSLSPEISRADDSYDVQIDRQLLLGTVERVETMLAGGPDPRPAIAAVEATELPFVVIGELAGAVHGSPLTLGHGQASVVVPADQIQQLTDHLEHDGAQGMTWDRPWADIDPVLTVHCADATELLISPEPRGTRGYADLFSRATPMQLGQNLTVPVADLLDLIRIANATLRPHVRAGRTALRAVRERRERAHAQAAA